MNGTKPDAQAVGASVKHAFVRSVHSAGLRSAAHDAPQAVRSARDREPDGSIAEATEASPGTLKGMIARRAQHRRAAEQVRARRMQNAECRMEQVGGGSRGRKTAECRMQNAEWRQGGGGGGQPCCGSF